MVKFILACWMLFTFAACNTLENRRDLYSHDTPFYYERPAATTTVQQTTTRTTTTDPIEFRPRASSEEALELPSE